MQLGKSHARAASAVYDGFSTPRSLSDLLLLLCPTPLRFDGCCAPRCFHASDRVDQSAQMIRLKWCRRPRVRCPSRRPTLSSLLIASTFSASETLPDLPYAHKAASASSRGNSECRRLLKLACSRPILLEQARLRPVASERAGGMPGWRSASSAGKSEVRTRKARTLPPRTLSLPPRRCAFNQDVPRGGPCAASWPAPGGPCCHHCSSLLFSNGTLQLQAAIGLAKEQSTHLRGRPRLQKRWQTPRQGEKFPACHQARHLVECQLPHR